MIPTEMAFTIQCKHSGFEADYPEVPVLPCSFKLNSSASDAYTYVSFTFPQLHRHPERGKGAASLIKRLPATPHGVCATALYETEPDDSAFSSRNLGIRPILTHFDAVRNPTAHSHMIRFNTVSQCPCSISWLFRNIFQPKLLVYFSHSLLPVSV
jgi:hypothetical protein